MFTHISNQTSMNPTGDRLTAELQQTTRIERPVVIGQGEKTTISEKVASGVELTGQKLGEGLDTIASGVEYAGQKLVSGVEYTGEKLKATGELIGEKLGETLAATGDKIEQTMQKAAEVVAEEKAKVELPGVVTFLQSGAARIFGHMTAPFQAETISPSQVMPVQAETSSVLISPVLKSDTKEIIVLAEKNLFSREIITTDIKTEHWGGKPTSRIDVMKQTGQLGPQPELHLPNLKVRDVPLNRAIEEQMPIHHFGSELAQLPSLGKKEIQDGAQFIDTVEQKTTEAVQAQATQFPSFVPIPVQSGFETVEDQKVDNLQPQTHQLSSLPSSAVLDGALFMEKAEQQIDAYNQQKSKDGSEQEQLPNLTAKSIQDGVAFMDQAEQQNKFNGQQDQGTVNQSLLPSLSTKDVHDGAMFIQAIENSTRST